MCRLRQRRGGRAGAQGEKEVREQTVEGDCVEPHGHRKDRACVLSEAGAAGETWAGVAYTFKGHDLDARLKWMMGNGIETCLVSRP